jgi:hypothetical protein
MAHLRQLQPRNRPLGLHKHTHEAGTDACTHAAHIVAWHVYMCMWPRKAAQSVIESACIACVSLGSPMPNQRRLFNCSHITGITCRPDQALPYLECDLGTFAVGSLHPRDAKAVHHVLSEPEGYHLRDLESGKSQLCE